MDVETQQVDLPNEMWMEVFKRLLVKDRKNVQLTCRRFYDICNCSNLQDTEEIVLYGNIDTVAVITLLASSRRKVFCLKFHNVSLSLEEDCGVLSFLQIHGAKVRSLAFDRYLSVQPELFCQMILNCVNLRSFAIVVDPGIDLTTNYVFRGFRQLVDNGILCSYVTSFTLILNRGGWFNVPQPAQFPYIFSPFPNIKELSLSCGVYHEDHMTCPAVWSFITRKADFRFSLIYDQLFKMRHQLKKLRLHLSYPFPTDSFINPSHDLYKSQIYEIFLKISRIEMRNLNELSLCWPNLWDASVRNPFLHLRHLTEITCDIYKPLTETISGLTVIQLLLNTTEQLRSLTFVHHIGYPEFLLTIKCFRALVRSQLQTLYFRVNVTIDFELSSLEGCLQPNRTLKHLEFKPGDNSHLVLFTTYFHSLETLVVKNNENVLSNIFQFQTKLCKLTLGPFHSLTLQQWLKNENVSCRLDCLINLCLTGQSLEVSEFCLSKFKFPHLKALTIRYGNVDASYNINQFLQSIRKLTELEYLAIEWGIVISSQQVSDLCSDLSKLRYFICFHSNIKPFGTHLYYQLFETCPSLLVAIGVTIRKYERIYSVKYIRDRLTNIVRNLKLNWPGYLHSNRYGHYDYRFIYEGIPVKYYDCSSTYNFIIY